MYKTEEILIEERRIKELKTFHCILGNSEGVCWSLRSVSVTNGSCFQSDSGVDRDHLWNHL